MKYRYKIGAKLGTKLCLFFKLKKNKHFSYLFDVILKVLSTQTARKCNNISLFNVKQYFFYLKKQILKFIRPSANSMFNVHNPLGIKLARNLRIGLSNLRKHLRLT